MLIKRQKSKLWLTLSTKKKKKKNANQHYVKFKNKVCEKKKGIK